MRLDELESPRVTIEEPAEGRGEQILMPVQLPQKLVIADQRGVQMIDTAPVASRRLGAAFGFAVPARRTAHPQPLVAEQRDHTALCRITLLHQTRTSLRIALRNGSRDRSRIGSRAREERQVRIK